MIPKSGRRFSEKEHALVKETNRNAVMDFDTIWLDARLATLVPARPGLGLIENGAVAARDGRIAFAGPMADLPARWNAARKILLDGRWVTPGLIDCQIGRASWRERV